MNNTKKNKAPWFLLPFVWLWNFLTWILSLTGRLLASLLGFVFLLVGFILLVTIIAAPIGIPFIIFGFLLILRGIF